ncbi:unnamed protein product [Lota lota]
MAPIGGEFLGFWLHSTASVSPDLGAVSLLLLLIISIFFSALCSNCGRRSFDMSEPEMEETPSTLTKVAELDESTSSARENPMIDDIRNDEFENSVPVQSSEDESGPRFTPWRSHLGTQKQPGQIAPPLPSPPLSGEERLLFLSESPAGL